MRVEDTPQGWYCKNTSIYDTIDAIILEIYIYIRIYTFAATWRKIGSNIERSEHRLVSAEFKKWSSNEAPWLPTFKMHHLPVRLNWYQHVCIQHIICTYNIVYIYIYYILYIHCIYKDDQTCIIQKSPATETRKFSLWQAHLATWLESDSELATMVRLVFYRLRRGVKQEHQELNSRWLIDEIQLDI